MLTDAVIEMLLPASGFSRFNRSLALSIALVVVGLLFYLGSKPVAVGLFAEPWDKLAHFAVFSAVSGLLWIALGGRLALPIVGLMAGIGALDEWHQASLPGRSADYTDWLTDVAAASLTVLVLQGWWKQKAAFRQRGPQQIS